MSTTAQNVTRIESAVQGFSRPQILAAMDELQVEVYEQRCDQTLKIDPATGYPPYLTTVNNQLHYDCPSDCWQTAAIFSEEPLRKYRSNADWGLSRTYYFQNRGYHRIEVTSRDATEDQVATVTFRENPGATTEKYYHAYWIKPTTLDTEQVQLTLPPRLHRKFRQAVIAILQGENYGQTGFDDAVIDKAARAIRNELNRGAQGRLGRTPIRQENLDYSDSSTGNWM